VMHVLKCNDHKHLMLLLKNIRIVVLVNLLLDLKQQDLLKSNIIANRNRKFKNLIRRERERLRRGVAVVVVLLLHIIM